MRIMEDEDVEMSGDEDNKKRSRSKFTAEREGEDEIVQSEEVIGKGRSEVRNTKRVRKHYEGKHYDELQPSDGNAGSDDFTALLRSHESRKRLEDDTNRDTSKENNIYNNNNNNRNSNSNNRNKNNNNKNNKNNNNTRNKPPAITARRFDREFDTATLPTTSEGLAHKIARFLTEQNAGLILAIVSHLGIPEALRFVRETAKKEEEGGVLTTGNGVKRRRSPGGCLFYLVKEGANEEMRKAIFTDERGKRARPKNSKSKDNKGKAGDGKQSQVGIEQANKQETVKEQQPEKLEQQLEQIVQQPEQQATQQQPTEQIEQTELITQLLTEPAV